MNLLRGPGKLLQLARLPKQPSVLNSYLGRAFMEFQKHVHFRTQEFWYDRCQNKINGTKRVTLDDLDLVAERRDEDDRRMFVPPPLADET